MEIVVFLAMMIVPFLSVAALVIAILNNKRIASLKSYVSKLVRSGAAGASREAKLEFDLDDI